MANINIGNNNISRLTKYVSSRLVSAGQGRFFPEGSKDGASTLYAILLPLRVRAHEKEGVNLHKLFCSIRRHVITISFIPAHTIVLTSYTCNLSFAFRCQSPIPGPSYVRFIWMIGNDLTVDGTEIRNDPFASKYIFPAAPTRRAQLLQHQRCERDIL